MTASKQSTMYWRYHEADETYAAAYASQGSGSDLLSAGLTQCRKFEKYCSAQLLSENTLTFS